MYYCLNENIKSDGTLSFGIDALDCNREVIKSFRCIFNDRKEAEKFIDSCNKNELSIKHLPDIIKDLLEEVKI